MKVEEITTGEIHRNYIRLKRLRPYLLKKQNQDGDESRSLLLQGEEGARRPDEELGVTVSHVVLETVLDDDGLHGLPVRGHQVVWPGVLTCHFIPRSQEQRKREISQREFSNVHLSDGTVTSQLN